ncbi:MAG: hypothetical protein ACJA2Y_000192 [Cycloclasticus pugetii]|jgi:hypothetical protein
MVFILSTFSVDNYVDYLFIIALKAHAKRADIKL